MFLNMGAKERLLVEIINAYSKEEFLNCFRNVVENYPLAADRIFHKKPFQSIKQIEEEFYKFIDSKSDEEKEEILRLHPELGSRSALSQESTYEQDIIGLQKLEGSLNVELQALNELYNKIFGFPFIICVRENDPLSIIEIMKERVQQEKETEIVNAINEVQKIVAIRLRDIFNTEKTDLKK